MDVIEPIHMKQRATFFAVVLLSFSAQGYSQGFFWNTASAQSQGMGGIYTPSENSALDALAVNPAGLALLTGPTADLSVSAGFARGSFSNSVNSNSPMSTAPGALPYGAFAMPSGKSRFSFGVGEVPDLMSVSQWNYVDAPGVAGASYGKQEQKSAILAARSVAGMGVALGKRVSLGVTFGVEYNSNTLNAPYIFQQQPTLRGLKTLLDLNTSGFGWNTSAGAIVRASRKVELSMAWKSRTIINSTGTASGDLAQQAAALGLAIPTGFHYSAAVHNVLPQSANLGVSWRVNPRWTLALQGDWTNWKSAFRSLPVALTDGTNPVINSLVNSTSLNDFVPLQWKDQYTVHAGIERALTERVSIKGGYWHANNPVPSSTLTPLTGAIMMNQLSAGLGYVRGRARVDMAYGFEPLAKASVGTSALVNGEYSNSTVKVGIQTVTVSSSWRF